MVENFLTLHCTLLWYCKQHCVYRSRGSRAGLGNWLTIVGHPLGPMHSKDNPPTHLNVGTFWTPACDTFHCVMQCVCWSISCQGGGGGLNGKRGLLPMHNLLPQKVFPPVCSSSRSKRKAGNMFLIKVRIIWIISDQSIKNFITIVHRNNGRCGQNKMSRAQSGIIWWLLQNISIWPTIALLFKSR